MLWFGAMMSRSDYKLPPLDKFLGTPVREVDRVRAFHAAWDKVDQALRH